MLVVVSVPHRLMPDVCKALTVTPDRGSARVTFAPLDAQLHMSYDGLYFLYQESTPDGLLHSDFSTSQTVAKMIMQGAEIQPTLLQSLSVRTPLLYPSHLRPLTALCPRCADRKTR